MSTETHTQTQTANMSQNPPPTAKPDLLPKASQYSLRGGLPNTPLAVSIISALLGGLLVSSLALAAAPALQGLCTEKWNWARPQLGVYLACMGLFHLCEFWTTAGWNPQKLTVDGQSVSQIDYL